MGTREDLGEKLGIKQQWISHLLAASKLGERYSPRLEISTSAIVDAAWLPGEERVKILETHEKGLVEAASIRGYARAVKGASEPVKEALLDVDVNPVIRANPIT